MWPVRSWISSSRSRSSPAICRDALDNLNRLMEDNAGNIAGTLGNLNSVTGDMAQILSAEKTTWRAGEPFEVLRHARRQRAQRVDNIIGNGPGRRAVLRRRVRRQAFADCVGASRRSGGPHIAQGGARWASDERSKNFTIRSTGPARCNLSHCWPTSNIGPCDRIFRSSGCPEKMKERADRAAKAPKKAERDSLRRQ